jgi:hypothetical protein
MRWPARVTLRSAIKASNATSKFKSVEARFTGLDSIIEIDMQDI